MIADKKTPFYSQKLDDKYNLLSRSIGIDTQTQSLSTRTIESSNLKTGDLNGEQLTFAFTVSPSAYIDWNNSNMEIGFQFTNNAKNDIPLGVSLPWNLLLYIFEEIKVQFNGTTVFNKVTGEYLETQTFKLLTEYTNEELNASQIVFAPVGDYNYNVGLEDGYGLYNKRSSDGHSGNLYEIDTNACDRANHYLTIINGGDIWERILYKRPTFRELFFSMPGFSKNLRNVNIVVKLKRDIPLAKIVDGVEGIMVIKKMRLQLHEYNFSPSAAISALNNKINGEDEHLSFIDVNKQDKEYSPYVTVTNQENVQWVAVTQFCHNVKSRVNVLNEAQYQNCGQFLLMNGYGTDAINDPAVNSLLHRSDLPPTNNPDNNGFPGQGMVQSAIGVPCANPISSIQAQYGSIMYPSNAIDTQCDGGTVNGNSVLLLKTDELYNEYRKAVGFKNPAVPEDIFRRTMPFFMVKFTPNIKLIQSGDIMIRMPGFSAPSNNSEKKVSIIYGQLKSFNISPSGIVSETIPSY